jgi:hypothetical protein
MGRRAIHIEYGWESQNERDHKKDQDEGRWIMLKWIGEEYDGLVWTESIWLRTGTSGWLL